jgi:hypothetical protein
MFNAAKTFIKNVVTAIIIPNRSSPIDYLGAVKKGGFSHNLDFNNSPPNTERPLAQLISLHADVLYYRSEDGEVLNERINVTTREFSRPLIVEYHNGNPVLVVNNHMEYVAPFPQDALRLLSQLRHEVTRNVPWREIEQRTKR